ncbi:MAG: AraC family transcriptional regulator [Chitinophagaceae bacterium]
MKKRQTAVRPTYWLAGATLIKNDQYLFQYYKGDFFTLFLTQPRNETLHHQLKGKHLDPFHPVRLLYTDEFVFEIFLDRACIEEYKAFCPVMSNTDDLGILIPFWSIGMEQAVKAFCNSSLKGPLADRFIYARVIDLLIQLVHHIKEINERPAIDEATIKYAEKAKQIILDDLSNYDTVERVARKVGISELDLQLAFRKRFGMTVGKFSKIERMQFAHDMLEKTDDILLSVALAVGYNDPGNFSVAFKNYYGYSPGYIQRKKKLFNSQQRCTDSE